MQKFPASLVITAHMLAREGSEEFSGSGLVCLFASTLQEIILWLSGLGRIRNHPLATVIRLTFLPKTFLDF